MRGVLGCRVCLVLCRSEDHWESARRLGLVARGAWHSQRLVRKRDKYPFLHRIISLSCNDLNASFSCSKLRDFTVLYSIDRIDTARDNRPILIGLKFRLFSGYLCGHSESQGREGDASTLHNRT